MDRSSWEVVGELKGSLLRGNGLLSFIKIICCVEYSCKGFGMLGERRVLIKCEMVVNE